MEFSIISNKGDKATLCIDDEMTVGDVKGVTAAMLDAPENLVMTVALNGKLLTDNDETWGELRARVFRGEQPQPMQRKLFCNLTDRPIVEEQSADVLRMLPTKEEKKMEQEQEREKAASMDAMVDALADNPAFMESLLGTNPVMEKMKKKSPEVARMLKDPDTLRTILKASIDPQRRREMERNAELQLAHISAMPGGQQMVNHYMDQIEADDEETDAQRQLRIGTSTAEVSDDLTHPDPTKEANNDPLPNPWAAAPNAVPASAAGPFGGGFDGGLGGANSFPFGSAFGNPFLGAAAAAPAAGPPSASAASGVAPLGGMDAASMQNFMAMLQSMAGAPPAAATPTPPPAASAAAPAVTALSEEALQRGLATLREMGFEDEGLCREALTACGGDAEAAVDYIAEYQAP